MTKGLLALLAVIVVGVGGWLSARHLLQGPPSAWLCREYSLSPQQACRVEQLQRDYGNRCGPFCDQMCEANTRLEKLALGSSTLTPALRESLAETDRIRTAARTAMLDHFYAVAAELPPDRRSQYLLKVLPLVIDSCGSR
jgi:hypothetical protein